MSADRMKSRSHRRLVLVALGLCAVLIAAPALAETYHVSLKNGQSYESRRPPEEASWDADMILFLTETGNLIGVERTQITSIEIETELRGYGERINSTTIFMGRTPNSAPAEEEDLSPAERQNQLLEALLNQSQQQPNYTMEQFVEPGDLGRSSGGIPVGFTQQVTPPLGVAGENPQ